MRPETSRTVYQCARDILRAYNSGAKVTIRCALARHVFGPKFDQIFRAATKRNWGISA